MCAEKGTGYFWMLYCLLLFAEEQRDVHNLRNICWLPKVRSGVTHFWTEALGKSQISEHQRTFYFVLDGKNMDLFLDLFSWNPWNSNAFFGIGSTCSVVYIHLIGKIIDSESYQRDRVLIHICINSRNLGQSNLLVWYLNLKLNFNCTFLVL